MELVRRMESCGSRTGKLKRPVRISGCGELKSKKRAAEEEDKASPNKKQKSGSSARCVGHGMASRIDKFSRILSFHIRYC